MEWSTDQPIFSEWTFQTVSIGRTVANFTFWVLGYIFRFYVIKTWIEISYTQKSMYSDQTSRSVASDLGLHCLHMLPE